MHGPYGYFYAGLVDEGVRIDNRPEAFASADSDAPEILNTIREQFGRDDLFVVLIEGRYSKRVLRQIFKN